MKYYHYKHLLPKREAERTTEVSDLFFQLDAEDRELVLSITEELYEQKKRKKKGGVLVALLPCAVAHDFVVSGIVSFWHMLELTRYI